jgi:hypothetical protein
MTNVMVYYFTKYDVSSDKNIRSQRTATLEVIAKHGGEPLMDTGMAVDSSCLDDDGFLAKEDR